MSDSPHQLSRRTFAAACATLVGALAGCSAWSVPMRVGRIGIVDPHPDDYLPVLDALIRTILPFDDGRFPLAARPVRSRLLELFPFEESADNRRVQQALLLFDAVELFPAPQAPVHTEERRWHAQWPDSTLTAAALHALQEEEHAAYGAFRHPSDAGHTFTTLPAPARAEYLELWRHSVFLARRGFYRSARAMVMITAYSDPQMWNAIGYPGPLLGRRA